MKNQALFSLKDKSKQLKCCLLQFLFGALRVNIELNDMRKIICLRKSEVCVEKNSVCKVIENWQSMAYTVCYAPISVTP